MKYILSAYACFCSVARSATHANHAVQNIQTKRWNLEEKRGAGKAAKKNNIFIDTRKNEKKNKTENFVGKCFVVFLADKMRIEKESSRRFHYLFRSIVSLRFSISMILFRFYFPHYFCEKTENFVAALKRRLWRKIDRLSHRNEFARLFITLTELTVGRFFHANFPRTFGVIVIADDDIKITLIATPRIFPKINFALEYGLTFSFVLQAYMSYVIKYFLRISSNFLMPSSMRPKGPITHICHRISNRTIINNNKTNQIVFFSLLHLNWVVWLSAFRWLEIFHTLASHTIVGR